jgi:hypothetical protein
MSQKNEKNMGIHHGGGAVGRDRNGEDWLSDDPNEVERP